MLICLWTLLECWFSMGHYCRYFHLPYDTIGVLNYRRPLSRCWFTRGHCRCVDLPWCTVGMLRYHGALWICWFIMGNCRHVNLSWVPAPVWTFIYHGGLSVCWFTMRYCLCIYLPWVTTVDIFIYQSRGTAVWWFALLLKAIPISVSRSVCISLFFWPSVCLSPPLSVRFASVCLSPTLFSLLLLPSFPSPINCSDVLIIFLFVCPFFFFCRILPRDLWAIPWCWLSTFRPTTNMWSLCDAFPKSSKLCRSLSLLILVSWSKLTKRECTCW